MADTSKITWPTTTPRDPDTILITLQKILQKTNAGGATEGGGYILSGHGAPVDPPGGDYAIYYDLDSSILYYWNDETAAWI